MVGRKKASKFVDVEFDVRDEIGASVISFESRFLGITVLALLGLVGIMAGSNFTQVVAISSFTFIGLIVVEKILGVSGASTIIPIEINIASVILVACFSRYVEIITGSSSMIPSIGYALVSALLARKVYKGSFRQIFSESDEKPTLSFVIAISAMTAIASLMV